jgi:CRP-like cAMP-binding protein
MLMWSGARFETPTEGNLLLRRLTPTDRALLTPHLTETPLRRGAALLEAIHAIDRIHFPQSGLLAIEERIGRGNHVEIAVVGREGMLGWPALLGSATHSHSAVARGEDGHALSIALAPLMAACRASPTMWATLLCFVQSVMVQMARAIATHLEHSLEQRVARWLLMRHDRIGGDQLMARHEEIADSLNTRRASVTDRLHILEGERLVRCQRGRIQIRDRPALEAFAGDAYGAAEAQYRTLIAPFGKSAA